MTSHRTSLEQPAEHERDKFLRMPKACISCVHYEPLGFDDDEHCPFPPRPYSVDSKPGRTPYGSCNVHMAEVFATEICGAHEPEPQVMLAPVQNRPEPRNPIQETFCLVKKGASPCS